ncbi:hypothetical protein GP2143_05140 [marine gamma proteobacterium HTCC2143]|uniref:PAS domain-containing protein n=1 Tax=marine gamma proteobacterium HTCC2143 TaxID=247633 RepID=A0YB78_9GAMM|nr:hypothetical protein GP2143_05140 [marine gamma proteobacterium HTCC2143]
MSAHELRNLNDALIEKCRQLQNQSDNAHRVNVIKQQLEQKYQLIVNHLSEVVWTADFDLNLDFVSPSILSLSGYSDTQAKKISLRAISLFIVAGGRLSSYAALPYSGRIG